MLQAKEIKQISKALGYEFKNAKLLVTAMTHRSVHHSGNNNERFEFLGDSILNFVIAEALYVKFPETQEGQLSRLRSTLVRGATLAEIARELQVGEFILLGPGEMKTGGHRRDSILADVIEALIAAIYLDSDVETCRQCVLKWFTHRLQHIHLDVDSKDAKTQLQEYLQARHLSLPDYKIQDIAGEAHDQRFKIACSVKEFSQISIGEGTSRRRAEQEAAKAFLQLLLNSAQGLKTR